MRNLTMSQLQRLRGLIRKTPALSEYEFALRPRHVEITAPRQLLVSLETLARQVEPETTDQWPAIVDEYFRRLFSGGVDLELAGVSFEDLADRLLPRLRPADDPVARNSYVHPVAPGLVEVLVLDNPDNISVLSDTAADRYGLDALRGAATRNLLDRPQQMVTAYDHEGTWIVMGDDHTATELLTLPRLVTSVAGDLDLSGGVVVAVPAQSAVIFHVPGDPTEAVKQVRFFAEAMHRDVPHPLSPEAFWWRDGELTPIDDDLVATMCRLLGEDDPGKALYRLADAPHEFTRPTDEVLARTYPQLIRPDARPDPSWWTYAGETIPGVLDLLALDLMPERVVPFHDEHVERHGLDTLREAGLRNLRAVPVEERSQDKDVHLLFGGPHMAATALIIDEMVERNTGERELPDGVLVAIPMRQVLIYHVPKDAGLADAMLGMAEIARAQQEEEPLDLISPSVYWWRAGEFVRLTHLRGDGTVEWTMPPDFGAVFSRLCPLPEVDRPAELDGSTEAVIGGIYPRLWHAADSREVNYGQEFAPGLISALVYEDADSLTFLTDDDVAHHGGVDLLRGAAMRNLTRDRLSLKPAEEHGLWFVWGGRHLSALVLLLDQVVEAITGAAPGGLLVSVPSQDVLVIRVLTGDDEADGEALRFITAFTGKHYDESPTCVSRHVYWWQDGVFELAPEVSG